jgi:hypothetical protein
MSFEEENATLLIHVAEGREDDEAQQEGNGLNIRMLVTLGGFTSLL